MLVYLFFVFTCGWCVCWLLFLNYQQHARDSVQPPAELSNLEDDSSSCRAEQLARRRRRRDTKRALLVGQSGKLELVKTEAERADQQEESECCPECQASALDSPDELVLDWPANRCAADSEEDSDEPEVASQRAWPLIELHENLASWSEEAEDGLPVRKPDVEQALNRSRLLSLRSSQLSHRAAVRQVSKSGRQVT